MMLLAFLSLLTLFFSHDVEARGLNVNAISASNGHSVLECWSLSAPVANFRGAANYPIGDFHGGFIGVIPPRTHIGQAWAAQPQYSIFLSGLVHIRLPNSTQEAWIQGGKYGILIAADTKNVSSTGHITDFPGSDETVIAQCPFVSGELPDHKVLYSGPCRMGELLGF